MPRKIWRRQVKRLPRISEREAKKRTWNGCNLPGALPRLRFVGSNSERVGSDFCQPSFSWSGKPFESDKIDRIVWYLQRRDGHGDHYRWNRSLGWLNVRVAWCHSGSPPRTG